METARELFEHELRDMYDAEQKLVGALETMAKKCSNAELVEAFETHQQVTEEQARRLEEVFGMLSRKPRREPCVGINGLIEEFSKFVKEKPSADILDVFATGAAEKVEQYEISAYDSLILLGNHLGISDAVRLFELTLAEEQETAELLKAMAQKLGPQLDRGERPVV
jgi:ferritin-like metal-binding protein YciE